MRKASMTMSCVADAVATMSAAPKTTYQESFAGSQNPSRAIAAIIVSCEHTSQPRRRPKSRENTGTSSASTTGAHRNLMV